MRVWIALVAVASLGLFLDGEAGAKKGKPVHKGKPAPAAPRPGKPAPVADVPQPMPDPPPAAARPVPSRPVAAPAPPPPKSGREVVERESKIEFDERAIQGQTASGAIYLFQRGESEFRSMIQVPDSFRERTVKQILPDAPKP